MDAGDFDAQPPRRSTDVITGQAIRLPGPSGSPGKNGVTLLAAVLIASPLLQWLYLTGLSYFTLLEPPFTRSRGLVLAMQLFFAPGNVLGVALGVGLMRRGEWSRRITRVVFLFAAGVVALQIAHQAASQRFDSNTLLAGATLVFAVAYFWYFGRSHVQQQFRGRPQPAHPAQAAPAPTVAAPARTKHPRGIIIGACVEILLGVTAILVLWRLHDIFGATALLDVGAGPGVADADGLLKTFVFVCLALLLSPHVLTAAASVGILFGRATNVARRHSLIACWSVVGCLLLTAWLVERPGLAFDSPSARILVAFCVVSLVWHVRLLYVLARARRPADVEPAQRNTKQ